MLAVMVAMQLPPRTPPQPSLEPSASLPAAQSSSHYGSKPQQRQPGRTASPAPPAAQPMALLLDVSMAAPIIRLPESSSR
jgi:hypothetical protein